MRQKIKILVVACVAAAAILLAMPAFGLFGIPYHEACVTTGTVATDVFWTPVVLLDSPYLGTATATAVRSESPGVSASASAANGSSLGVFAMDRWAVYSQKSEYVLGPGSAAPCPSGYYSVMNPAPIPLRDGATTLTVQLLGPGNMSDVAVPTQITELGVVSVLFFANYRADTTGGYGTCGGGLRVGLSSNERVVGVPLEVSEGLSGTVGATVQTTASYTYSFPIGGEYDVDSNTSAGLAFDFYAC